MIYDRTIRGFAANRTQAALFGKQGIAISNAQSVPLLKETLPAPLSGIDTNAGRALVGIHAGLTPGMPPTGAARLTVEAFERLHFGTASACLGEIAHHPALASITRATDAPSDGPSAAEQALERLCV